MKNLGEMMKQVQEMQSRLEEAQAKLEDLTVTGEAGGGMVKVTLNGKGAMRGIELDPGLLKADEREILEDLIVAAYGEARAKMEKLAADNMKDVTGGLPLPPGFQMPF